MITTSFLICMTVFSMNMRNADVICDNAHIIEEMSKTYDLDPSLIIPETSIRVGSKILNYWLHKYAKGNETTALCGYNAGFRCKGENKNKQGLKYAKAVLKYRKYFKRKMRIQKRKYKNEMFANH